MENTVMSLGWLSIVPPLITIVLALWSKRIVESLLAGIAACAFIVDFTTTNLWHSLLYFIPNTFSTIAGHPASDTLQGVGMVKDSGRAEILIFIILLGSFLTVLDHCGGAMDFAKRTTKWIQTKSQALLATIFLGFAIFTSAYFCILVTGTVMRPICDRLKISREKLAFLCDASAAPSKALIPISGWIAFMVTLIQDNIPAAANGNGFAVFIQTMPYNFYCVLLPLFLILMALKWIPDFGPMKRAELRVSAGLLHKEGSKPMVSEDDEVKLSAMKKEGTVWDMALPLLTSVLLLLVLGMWNPLNERLGLGLPKVGIGTLSVMNVSFFAGILAAFFKYTAKGLMKPKEFLDQAIDGTKSALIGAMIIIMAVTLGDMLKALPPEGLGTARYMIEVAQPYIIPSLLPAMVFLLGAVMAFATGTSWGTWAIMMPIGIPIALSVGLDPIITTAAILSGGAFGDHCSPISDTTVLSSLASNVDHVEHVRTQLPYAIAVATVALIGFVIVGVM